MTLAARLLALSILPFSQGAAQPGPGRDSVAARLRATVDQIAHDSTAGRATGTPELRKVAEYLSARLEATGLRPPPGQRARIVRYDLVEAAIEGSRAALTLGGQRFPLGDKAQLIFAHDALSAVTAPVVVLSGRTTDPATFEALSGFGLADRAVIIAAPQDARGNRGNGVPLGELMAGANPPIIIYASNRSDSALAALRPNLQSTSIRPRTDSLDRRLRFSHGILEVPAELLSPILARHGFDLDRAMSLPDAPLSVTPLPRLAATVELPRSIRRELDAPNVLGWLEGTDPSLRNEIVVVSAHFDHLGVGQPDSTGDRIYNGADDNASGVAVVLEIARALSRTGTRRSLLFALTSGEEVGIRGGEALATMTWGSGRRVIADINVDGVGRPSAGDSVAVVGMTRSRLGVVARGIATSGGSAGLIPVEREEILLSGDHHAFSRRGIPSVSFYSGTLQPYYHRPSDEPPVVDIDWLVRVTTFATATVKAVADGPPGAPGDHARR